MQQLAADFVTRAEESDFVAVVDDDGVHRASAVIALAQALATALGASGLQVTRTVIVQADNSWRTLAATVAVGLHGGVLALVNRHTTRSEMADAFQDIRPDAVLAEPSAWQDWGLSELLGAEPATTALDGWSLGLAAQPLGSQRWGRGAVIGLTSGSTGRAKGVVQSEGALRYATQSTIKINRLQSGDPVAAIVPLSSSAAFCFGVAMAMELGSPLVTSSRWNAVAMLQRMAEADVRWVMCVPTMALQLGRAAAESGAPGGLRSLTVGGGPMDLEALASAETALGAKILRVFGMSECLGHTSPDLDDEVGIRLGRDGRPFPGTTVRAVDNEGRPVGPGNVGQAQVRGPSLFLGYARAGALAPVELSGDGFFPTGDLVLVHEDGTVKVMGREKDVIIRGGLNVDVLEVEGAVAKHPAVLNACVVPLPDKEFGERIAVLVVTDAGSDLGLSDLTDHLRAVGLSKTKWPEFLFTIDELPQTRVGKISRPAARDLASDLHAAEAAAATPTAEVSR